MFFFFFSSRRRHTRYWRDWSSDVCSSDLGVLREHVFDLQAGDVLAPRDDDVLGAVLDLDHAVGVPNGEVARAAPAIDQGLRGRLRVLEVALHHRVATQPKLADGLAVARDRRLRSEEHTSELQSRQYLVCRL